MNESYETTTNVRFPRTRWWALLVVVPMILTSLFVGRTFGVWFFLLPAPLFLFLANRVHVARVIASPDGLRIGQRVIPRSRLASALVRHDGPTTFVSFRGDERLDVEVPNNVEADALMRALHLDASSSAAELQLQKPSSMRVRLLPYGALLAWFLLGRHHMTFETIMLAALAVALAAFTIPLALRVTLRIGADGIVFQQALKKERFVPHDAITDVRANDDSIVITEADGRESSYVLPGSRSDARESSRERAQRSDEAEAIVRRIRQARQAFREGANAPELAVALARGSRSVRDWLVDLRRLGEGAASTFRTIGVVREQLFDVVESSTAAAKERIAALVALRAALREDEKPRIRVAAQRIAAPELRDRMIRILDATDESELEDQLRAMEE